MDQGRGAAVLPEGACANQGSLGPGQGLFPTLAITSAPELGCGRHRGSQWPSG